jgi:hypothetical protein
MRAKGVALICGMAWELEEEEHMLTLMQLTTPISKKAHFLPMS